MTITANRWREAGPFRFGGNENGMVLPVTLFLMLTVGLFAAVGMKWSLQDVKRTGQYVKTRKAFYIAETGLQEAVNYFNYDSTGASPGAASNGFDDELDGSNWPSAFTGAAYGNGTYTVTVADNDDDDSDPQADRDSTIVLTATGLRNGVQSTLEAVVLRPAYKANSAITTNGNLTGSGSFTVQGTSGSIHSNADFDQSGGSGTATQGATASQSCSGTICVASGVVEEAIPIIEPSSYLSIAQFILRSDGKVEDVTASEVYMEHSGCWKLDGLPADPCSGDPKFEDVSRTGAGLWKINGSVVADGIYYVQGDVSVLGTPDPWQTTIIADGYIDFGGNAEVINYQGGPTPDIDNLFLVAGTDLEFSGNPTNQIQGIMAAKEQIDISGTVDLNGYIVSADVADVENLVSPDSSISGSLTVTYNGGFTAPMLSDKVIILSWQET